MLARFLAQRPEGLHPDGTQGGGYLIPALVEQCQQFEELTGNAGDVALLHPLMLHRASANPSGRARFIQNGRLSLEEPLCFNRADPADSPHEAVLAQHESSEEAVWAFARGALRPAGAWRG